MNISKSQTKALVTAVALAFSAAAFAQTTATDQRTMNQAVANLPAAPISKDPYKASGDRIKADYKAAHSSCDSLSANAKDICVAEAKANEKIAKAELEARYKNTAKARYNARAARADAEYSVAKEKCDDLSGNAKNVCVKGAKAVLTRAKADAKVDRQVADVRTGGNEKIAEARKDAASDKRDAEYAVAKEKCDALAGAAKDRCVSEAKSRFGKT